mmetsp:Transcript_100216/g.311732  ORF Transcript_100216/g.311732 Transcript_100216/m.311732 type:complete len:519 (-) Transcript_100216:210-1766(-)
MASPRAASSASASEESTASWPLLPGLLRVEGCAGRVCQQETIAALPEASCEGYGCRRRRAQHSSHGEHTKAEGQGLRVPARCAMGLKAPDNQVGSSCRRGHAILSLSILANVDEVVARAGAGVAVGTALVASALAARAGTQYLLAKKAGLGSMHRCGSGGRNRWCGRLGRHYSWHANWRPAGCRFALLAAAEGEVCRRTGGIIRAALVARARRTRAWADSLSAQAARRGCRRQGGCRTERQLVNNRQLRRCRRPCGYWRPWWCWMEGWLPERRTVSPACWAPRQHRRAEEGELVLSPCLATHQSRSIVVGVAIDTRAHGMHTGDVRSRPDGAGCALLRGNGRRSATIRCYRRLLGMVPPCPSVVPLRVNELHAGPVATGDQACVGVDGLQAGGDRPQTLPRRTVTEGEARAVDDMHLLQVLASAGPNDVKLERQGVAVHQAHVHVVAAGHLAPGLVRSARGAHASKGALKLCIDGWRAARVVRGGAGAPHATLARSATAAQAAFVPMLIAGHLWPVAH